MASLHDIPEIDRKGLRDFALQIGTVVAPLFGAALPWLFDRPFRAWPWIFAAVLITWGLVAPSTLRPLYYAWMKLGLLLNKVTSPLLMAALFFVAITPVGLIRQMLGHETPKRRDPAATTYRVRDRPHSTDLTRPF